MSQDRGGRRSKRSGISAALEEYIQRKSTSAPGALDEELRTVGQAPLLPAVNVAQADLSSLRKAVEQLKQIVEVREGTAGSALDRAVTIRDLVADGVIKLKLGQNTFGGGNNSPVVQVPRPAAGSDLPSFAVPPSPSGLAAAAAVGSVILTWSMVPYQNQAYVEVWRSGTDNLAQAVKIGQTPGIGSGVYADLSAAPGATYYYWVRAVNAEATPGPYNAQAGTRADTAFSVDDFFLAAEGIGAIPPGTPFFVQAVPTTINGVPVPAGVYMRAAYIADGTISTAKIGHLAVTDAKIASLSVSKLTAGSVAVGEYLQSTGYVAGTSGWRIHGDGTAEFQTAIVRGTVFASAGAIGGSIIASDHIRSDTWTSGSGWRLGSDGSVTIRNSDGTRVFDLTAVGTAPVLRVGSALRVLADGSAEFSGALNAATGTFAGALSAATGTFAGALSGATGTFSGALTAQAVNAVRTINIGPDQVTVTRQVRQPDGFFYARTPAIFYSLPPTDFGGGAVVLLAGGFIGNNADFSDLWLYRNGVPIKQLRAKEGISSSVDARKSLFFFVDYPSEGEHTYGLGTEGVANYDRVISGLTLAAFGGKR